MPNDQSLQDEDQGIVEVAQDLGLKISEVPEWGVISVVEGDFKDDVAVKLDSLHGDQAVLANIQTDYTSIPSRLPKF